MKYKSYSNRSTILWIAFFIFLYLGGIKLLIALSALAFSLITLFFPLIAIGGILLFFGKTMQQNARVNQYFQSQSQEHKHFVEILIHSAAHLIHADHKVDQRELLTLEQFFRQSMGFQGVQLIWVQDIIRDALANPYSLNELCSEINKQFNLSSKRSLISLLYQIALSDQDLHKNEEAIIQQIAGAIHISKEDLKQIKAMLSPKSNQETHYKILGLSKGASKDEIKKAYRSAAKKHHPDKVRHLGAEVAKQAEEKMQKINAAYQALMKMAT